eukprot:2160366-Karenia_brevis.AAC.1
MKSVMPSLGLRFSRLEAVAAAGGRTTVDLEAFAQASCTINREACVSVMKSPVGNSDYCEKEIRKRVQKAITVIDVIGQLPDEHCG